MKTVAALAGRAFQAHHGELFDERGFQVMGFDLFRVDIFSIA